ncbi:MAG: zinc-dependent alcohol dehydrogenase [Dermatophilaceae bacterium]
MRLLTLPQPGNLVWEQVPEPVAAPHEVTIAVTHVGICGSDIEVFRGNRPPHMRHGFPVIGHELCGVVESVGAHVGGLRVGDTVTCVEGWGAFADRVISTPENILRLPARLDPADACLTEVLPGVAMAAWRTGITRSSEVLVVGQGLSGLLITRLVHLHGCALLTVVDPVAERLALAREFGADVVVQHTVEDWLATGPRGGYDVAILSTPANVVSAVAPLMRPRSRIVPYGGLDPGAVIDVLQLHRSSISLVKESEGIGGIHEARRIWRDAVDLAADGVLPLHRLRTHTLDFDQVAKAFELRRHEPSAIHVVCKRAVRG